MIHCWLSWLGALNCRVTGRWALAAYQPVSYEIAELPLGVITRLAGSLESHLPVSFPTGKLYVPPACSPLNETKRFQQLRLVTLISSPGNNSNTGCSAKPVHGLATATLLTNTDRGRIWLWEAKLSKLIKSFRCDSNSNRPGLIKSPHKTVWPRALTKMTSPSWNWIRAYAHWTKIVKIDNTDDLMLRTRFTCK